MDVALDGRLYHRQIERVNVRCALAVQRTASSADPDKVARLTEAARELDREIESELALGRCAQLWDRLGLLEDEIDLLWTVVAAAVDARVLGHLRVLGGSEVSRGISLGVHAHVAELDGRRTRMLLRRLMAPNPLLHDGLLEWGGDPELAPIARPLVAPARTMGWLAGLDVPDERMRDAGAVVRLPPVIEQDAAQRAALASLAPLFAAEPSPLIILEGPEGSGRRTAAAQAAATLGCTVVALDLRQLPKDEAIRAAALVGLRRECRLRDAIPLVANVDELLGGEDASFALHTLARAIDAWRGRFVVTTSVACPDLGIDRTAIRVAWNVPDVATRRRLWVRALGPEAELTGRELDDLAFRYALGPDGIARAAESGHTLAAGARLGTRHVIEGVRSNIAIRFGELATHQTPRHAWDDVVLAPDLQDQVIALIGRVRQAHLVLDEWGFESKVARGGGVAALFSGPPGTGKTMVAGLIAAELGLELYQIDLSKVVSKWVGETEKQLSRVFDAAEAGHALLLFDEADALFARRTKVASSSDRYANLEVNYLLQRIESFSGLTILTTNFETGIDPALRRRLAAHIAFWPPDLEERAQLWRGFIPRTAPRAKRLDFHTLADRFAEMTGANIRNAVVSAAFLAAAEDSEITQAHLERAARGEYLAMGRVLSRR